MHKNNSYHNFDCRKLFYIFFLIMFSILTLLFFVFDKNVKADSTEQRPYAIIKHGSYGSVPYEWNVNTHVLTFVDIGNLPEVDFNDNNNWFKEIGNKIEEIRILNKVKAPNNSRYLFASHSLLAPKIKYNLYPNLRKISGLENLDVSNVNDFSGMFLNQLNAAGNERDLNADFVEQLENWNTTKALNFSYMFYHQHITDLSAIGKWDVSHVNNFQLMFNGMRYLKKVDFTNWNMKNVFARLANNGSGTRNMFAHDNQLNDLKIGINNKFFADTNLPVPDTGMLINNTNIVTSGKWQEVGTGTFDNPNGIIWSNKIKDLISGYWVWQPQEDVKKKTINDNHSKNDNENANNNQKKNNNYTEKEKHNINLNHKKEKIYKTKKDKRGKRDENVKRGEKLPQLGDTKANIIKLLCGIFILNFVSIIKIAKIKDH